VLEFTKHDACYNITGADTGLNCSGKYTSHGLQYVKENAT